MLICILTTAGLYLLSGGGVYAALCRQLIERPQTERMRNVTVEARTSAPERLAVYVPEKTGATEAPQAEPAALIQPPLLEPAASPAPAPDGRGADTVLETTIEGGMRIKNETKYWVSATELLAQGTQIRLPAGQLRSHDGDHRTACVRNVVDGVHDDGDRVGQQPDHRLESGQQHVGGDPDEARPHNNPIPFHPVTPLFDKLCRIMARYVGGY